MTRIFHGKIVKKAEDFKKILGFLLFLAKKFFCGNTIEIRFKKVYNKDVCK